MKYTIEGKTIEIFLKKTSEIKAYEKNARTHPKKQIDLLKENIKAFGYTAPIVIDKDLNIIAGHGRLQALNELKVEEVPCVYIDYLNEKQVKALRLADNKLQEMSEWDMDLIIPELKELDDDLLNLTGFDKDLLIEPDAKDDEVPDVPEEPKSKLGDIYQLGNHRIMCGDSTKIEDVEKLMDGKKADMSFTSPPYNVGHNVGGKRDSKYENSDDNLAEYRELITDTTNIAITYAKDVFVNLQILANNKKDILLWLAELVDLFKDIFFWKKQTAQPAMASNVANSQTELILLFGKENTSRSWGNQRFRGTFSNMIETKSASGENKNAKIHNATFPVELPMKFIVEAYKENSLILDLFLGTGTTLIACEKTNRICYGMELDPKYIDVIIKRYEDYTGNKAIKL